MNDRTTIAQSAAQGLQAYAANATQTRVTIGFDGFVDSIIRIVDQRQSAADYTTLPTITSFSERVEKVAGRSGNFEYVVKQEKLGGNGPIMANAMASATLGVTCIGALGAGSLNPVFNPLAEKADVIPVIANAATDGLEFNDGKLMMGRYAHWVQMTGDELLDALDRDRLFELVKNSELIAMLNWVMMPPVEAVWQYLNETLLPQLVEQDGKRRKIFIDLCDPQNRQLEDLQRALKLLTSLDEHADVIFGMNFNEARQVAKALGLADVPEDPMQAQALAVAIREAMNIACAVVHPRQGAAAALRQTSGVAEATFLGPFVKNPKLSTGAGDNFNAGFCTGLLAGLPVEQALCVGTATSGFYVREARSPMLHELIDFCQQLPEPE